MPATLRTTKPLRGRRNGAPEAPLLIIPGRPQAKLRSTSGTPLRAGEAYLAQVRALAKRAIPNTPAFPDGPLRLTIDLHYALSEELIAEIGRKPATWHQHSIPNADTAASLILSGLTGILYTHTSQVGPLTIRRHITSSRETIATYGQRARRGAAVIDWEAA